MAEYRLSRRAATDLKAIAEFSIQQARRYRDELNACLSDLAQNPGMGRGAEQLANRLRRFEHGSHIIFYQPQDDGVFVVRVLHYRMDVAKQL